MSLLQLNERDLEKELQKIIAASKPKKKFWTQREIEIVQKLRAKNVPYKDIAKAIDRTPASIGYLISNSPYYED